MEDDGHVYYESISALGEDAVDGGIMEDVREERAQNCAVKYSVDVPMPQIMETGRLKRVSKRIKEHADVLALEEKMQERFVEEIIDIPVLRVLGESIEAVRHFPGGKVRNYIAEQTVDSRISHVKEEIIEGVRHVPQEQVQCLDKTDDVSIVRQVRVPSVQAVQKIVAVPQVQFPDRVLDVPVLTPGTTVQSELCYGGDGKPRASNVAENQSMLGWVKSFRDQLALLYHE